MAEKKSYLKGLRVLAVDDEEDVLDTIAEALETATVDRAQDFKTAVKKINEKTYDLASSISWVWMGSLCSTRPWKKHPHGDAHGSCAERRDPFWPLFAKAPSPICRKKTGGNRQILNDLLAAQAAGEPTWKLLFEKLGEFLMRNSVPAAREG